MLQQFLSFITTQHLCTPPDRVLLAVSGGKDSMAMLHLFHQAGFNIGVAHCNFKLRGADADKDEELVIETAQALHIPVYTTRFATQAYASENKISIQMAARELRYSWFEQMRQQHNYQHIAVAHHQNDAVETLLINLIRGTGIDGLGGPKPKNGYIIRPLLAFGVTEIEQYIQQHHIVYREDSSNSSTKYLRNKVRLEVLPLLQQMNPAIVSTLTHTISRMEDTAAIQKVYIASCKEQLLRKETAHWTIHIADLQQTAAPQTVLYFLLTDFGFSAAVATDVFTALNGQAGKAFLSPTHRVIKDRELLYIEQLPTTETVQQMHFSLTDNRVIFNACELHIQVLDAADIVADKNLAFLDAALLTEPLTIRYWQTGDSFTPLGMHTKKNISNFLTDLKLPLPEKEKQAVVLSGNTIVWVVGQRIANEYKITANTKKTVLLTVKNR